MAEHHVVQACGSAWAGFERPRSETPASAIRRPPPRGHHQRSFQITTPIATDSRGNPTAARLGHFSALGRAATTADRPLALSDSRRPNVSTAKRLNGHLVSGRRGPLPALVTGSATRCRPVGPQRRGAIYLRRVARCAPAPPLLVPVAPALRGAVRAECEMKRSLSACQDDGRADVRNLYQLQLRGRPRRVAGRCPRRPRRICRSSTASRSRREEVSWLSIDITASAGRVLPRPRPRSTTAPCLKTIFTADFPDTRDLTWIVDGTVPGGQLRIPEPADEAAHRDRRHALIPLDDSDRPGSWSTVRHGSSARGRTFASVLGSGHLVPPRPTAPQRPGALRPGRASPCWPVAARRRDRGLTHVSHPHGPPQRAHLCERLDVQPFAAGCRPSKRLLGI